LLSSIQFKVQCVLISIHNQLQLKVKERGVPNRHICRANLIDCKISSAQNTNELPVVVAIWIWFCAYLTCAGWALSAIHQLNARGYAVVLLIWFVALSVWKIKRAPVIISPLSLHGVFRKLFRRFRRPFPAAFLILSAMSFIGGLIYQPTNYDTLAYRIPRVLHWLAADQWHWIHTAFPRMNIHSVGIEWLYAPVFALLKTDRPLFLIEAISFAFLPGLFFSILTRLGVRRRVSWHWMWLAPTGYGFLLQAGGICNDLYGATLALAGIDFALRTNSEKTPWNFCTSALAMAAATSSKSSNLPLLLPWGIILLPSLKILLRRPWLTTAACTAAVFASAAPLMALNIVHTGSWTGGLIQSSGVRNEKVILLGANVVLTIIGNFVPPIFPMANQWNSMVQDIMPPHLANDLSHVLEPPGCRFELPDLQVEENGGLGFGVSVLLLVSSAAAFLRERTKPSKKSIWLVSVKISSVIAFLSIMEMSRWTAIVRYLLPYYVLLFPLLLADGRHDYIVRRRWWRMSAFVVFSLAAILLIIAPSRPLFPALTIIDRLYARSPNSGLIARAYNVYTAYYHRNQVFDPVISLLPPNLKLLGMVTWDDPETVLWRPFGSRRIEHVCPQDTAVDLRARGLQYVLVKEAMFGDVFEGSFEDWLRRVNAQVIQKIPLEVQVKRGEQDWYLVKLN
jgi:hypothetical protein